MNKKQKLIVIAMMIFLFAACLAAPAIIGEFNNRPPIPPDYEIPYPPERFDTTFNNN